MSIRLPAEWEPHAATWVSWPHKHETWPGRFEQVRPQMALLVRAGGEALRDELASDGGYSIFLDRLPQRAADRKES